jgi:hypothetical protein
MTSQMPYGVPPPVKVGLGRSNVVVVLAVLLFCGGIVFFCGKAAFQMEDQESRVVNGLLAAAFAVALVLLLIRLPKLLSPRYVVVDHTGLSIQQGAERVLVPWGELVAVGIAYEVPAPEQAKTPLSTDAVKEEISGYLAQRASEALQVSDQRRLFLEIFPGRPDAPTAWPRLKPFWKALPPPYPHLSEWAWRFPLPPVTAIGQQIADGLYQRAPRHWLGWFPRPWSGSTKK